MPRPIILGVVGDSAAGKTTLTRGLVRILGEDQVTHVGLDDYHRYDRAQRAANGITPLHPDANHLDVMTQHVRHLRAGEAILKPVYRHTDGTFAPATYVEPQGFAVLEGLLGYHTDQLCDLYDVRVYLAPPEVVRRKWKVDRDCSRRGYTTDQVLAELDRREPDSAAYIRPQQRYADLVVSFMPGDTSDAEHLNADLVLRAGLPHPDLSPFIGNGGRGIKLIERGAERLLRIPGDIDRERAGELEEAIWDRLHFASHLRSQRLGEFTVGTELRRSESLALVQLLILYHVVTARAAIALGGPGTRAELRVEPGEEARDEQPASATSA
jgi:phosphoribulokinase